MITAFSILPLKHSLIDSINSTIVEYSSFNLNPDLIKLLTLSNWFYNKILDGRNCTINVLSSWLSFDSNPEEACRLFSSKFSENLILMLDEKFIYFLLVHLL